MPAMPIHPRTGLRAVFVSERTGRVYWPVRGASDDSDNSGQQQNGQQGQQSNSDSYPANTPWQDMTPGEQVNYWKAQSRKHENRASQFGDLTPDELKSLRERAEKADNLEHDLSSDTDKRVAEAKKNAESEKDAHYRPQLVDTAFRIAIGDRRTSDEVDEFIADLNKDRFIGDDGRVDTAKVLARVEQFAPAKGNSNNQQQGRGPSSHGQGNRGSSNARPSVASGRDLWAERHPART